MSAGRERLAEMLPGYIVGTELGRGAFGVVWAGEHRRVGRRVAIKELTAPDAATRERFLAEAKVLASLEHPHVVPLYDYVEDGEQCLLVMERLEGGTLVERFFAPQSIDIASACAVAMVTCAGLHHAHRRGVLHRDVKPENLLFSAEGVLKVTDFGVAKVLTVGASSYRTAIGELKGTPAYMAPEQLTGKEVGPGVDIYATGLLLYELLTGRLPFSDEGPPIAVALRRLNDDPIPLDEFAPDLRGPLAEVTMQALNRSPEDRYATAEDFGVAISRAATTTLGAGWLDRSHVALLSPGPILQSALIAPATGVPDVQPEREVIVRQERPLGPTRLIPDPPGGAPGRPVTAGSGIISDPPGGAPGRPVTAGSGIISDPPGGAPGRPVTAGSGIISDPAVVGARSEAVPDRSTAPVGVEGSAPSWEALVHADYDYYQRIAAEGVAFPVDYPTRSFALVGAEIRIGRRSTSRGLQPELDLSGPPEDLAISHVHGSLIVQPDGSYALVDCGSTNGTTLNDDPDPVAAHVPVPLGDGDRIHLGAWTTVTIRSLTA